MASEETRRHYRAVEASLRRAILARGEAPTPEAFAREIAGRRLRRSSRQLYRSAVFFVYEWSGDAEARFGVAFASSRDRVVTGRRTRKAGIPEEVAVVLMAVLEEHSAMWRYAGRTRALVRGTRAFGLRPSEWRGAVWSDPEQSALTVINGKFADELLERGPQAGRRWRRGNGRERVLMLPDDPEAKAKLVTVADMAMRCEHDTPWREHARAIRATHARALRVVVGRGWAPRRFGTGYAIYSHRHAFAADAKASVSLFDGEVAALMGHASIESAVRCYAPRRSGRPRVALRPALESMVGVHDRMDETAKCLGRDLVLELDVVPVRGREMGGTAEAPGEPRVAGRGSDLGEGPQGDEREGPESAVAPGPSRR